MDELKEGPMIAERYEDLPSMWKPEWRISAKIIVPPTARRLSFPTGMEWLRGLHESNLPISTKLLIAQQHHTLETIEGMLGIMSGDKNE